MKHLNAAAALVTRTEDSFMTRAREILAAKAADAVKGTKKKPNNLWDVLVKRAPLRHAIDALLRFPEKGPEKAVYDAVYVLLNKISFEYLKAVHGRHIPHTTPALVFQSLHGHTIPGDYLSMRTKPDWQGFMAQFSALEEAVSGPAGTIQSLRPMSALDVVGEGKLDEQDEPLGQTKWYMASHKRCRPDLATVHGFQLGRGQIHLASLNACGMTASGAYDRGDLEAWISLVVLVYHSSDTRDQRLTYAPSPSDYKPSGRWDIRRDPNAENPDFSVFPNYASLAPGRMTWTAFVPGEIPDSRSRDDFKKATEQAPAVGFLKVSWQRPSVRDEPPANPVVPVVTAAATDSTARTEPSVDAPGSRTAVAAQPAAARGAMVAPDLVPDAPPGDVGAATVANASPPQLPLTEGELLRYLHKDGWLPGLVRYHDFPQRDDTIEATIKGKTHVRFKEILHLASVGEPLTQCGTPRQILEVAYDLAETHLQMLKRKIIHRDLSWFNYLCNPKHDPATLKEKSELTGIPCVEKIFGNEDGKPVVLLIDLDHATHTDRIWKPGYKTGLERTGTPMFVALELSGSGMHRFNYTKGLDEDDIEDLTNALTAIENHETIFQRAFPGDSGSTFMDDFAKVIVQEKARKKARPRVELYSDPLELHRAHHDVQTIYWTMLWSFARALPRGHDAFDSSDFLNTFCAGMLSHSLGNEANRLKYLKDEEGCIAYLHSSLTHFARLFRSLALYFSIPWHLYLKNGTVQIDHAHHAIRRILLAEIVFLRTEAGQVFNVALDKMQPRIFEAAGFGARKTITRNEFFTRVGTGRGTGSKRTWVEANPDAQLEGPEAKKKKVEEGPVDDEANETTEAGDDPTNVNDGTVETTKAANVPVDDRTAEEAIYAGTEIRPGSAKAMQNLFRESRLLWFGTGRRV
ncbi:hypothetical protein AURDEDRAFT_150956 [Auricularia subglabra TFB-10046 SS5]|nr:hypothetical protein AURDEDRAFT_150956 [Auricularia subglabra TFB-10046 SS5]